MGRSVASRLGAAVCVFIATSLATYLFLRGAGPASAAPTGGPSGMPIGTARAEEGQAEEPDVFRVPPTVFRVEALGRLVDKMTEARVVKVVDGDTIDIVPAASTGLGKVERLRLIGVDTPETKDPRRPVQAFGKEASAYLKGRLLGRDVRLAFERQLRDRYGRLLAYAFLEDGACVNLDIVAEGYGHAYVKYPFIMMDDFVAAEREARERRRGLWGLDP